MAKSKTFTGTGNAELDAVVAEYIAARQVSQAEYDRLREIASARFRETRDGGEYEANMDLARAAWNPEAEAWEKLKAVKMKVEG